jgi:hypothetical protein
MAKAKKGAGRKTARKPAATDAEKEAQAREKEAAKNAPAPPSPAALKAAAEQQVPLEPRGPGVEHEDHEGGITDSLAKKGVRAPIPTAEEREELEAKQPDGFIRAPSVRDRQTGMGSLVAEGGFRRGEPAPGEKGRKSIPVIALRLGQYPANGRLRAEGEAFIYVMGPDEKKLPSWMKDPTGAIETRGLNEPSGVVQPPIVVEIPRPAGVSDSDVRVRRGTTTRSAAGVI